MLVGTPNNISVSGITSGIHYWNVSCVGNAVYGVSPTYNFTSDNSAPGITASITPSSAQVYDPNKYYFVTSQVTDNYAIDKAWLTVDGTSFWMQPTNGTAYRIALVGLLPGNHSFVMYANDTVGNVNQTGQYQYNVLQYPTINATLARYDFPNFINVSWNVGNDGNGTTSNYTLYAFLSDGSLWQNITNTALTSYQWNVSAISYGNFYLALYSTFNLAEGKYPSIAYSQPFSIYNVQQIYGITSLATNDTATISYLTNTNATTNVTLYIQGITTGTNTNTLSTTKTEVYAINNHTIIFNNLDKGTKYTYVVSSCAVGGCVSNLGQFTTFAESKPDMVAGWTVLVFFLALTIGVFFLANYAPPMFDTKTKNFLTSRALNIFGIMLIMVDTNIVWQFGFLANLGINNTLSFFFTLSMWAMIIAIVFLAFNMVNEGLLSLRREKQSKRDRLSADDNDAGDYE
jgi:hypothetical protein